MHSTNKSPTLLVYDGAAGIEQAIQELASYQGVPATMVLAIDWEINGDGHARYDKVYLIIVVLMSVILLLVFNFFLAVILCLVDDLRLLKSSSWVSPP